MRTGNIAIVGAGPGDPELITVKAMRRLESADVILYDRLIHPGLLELARPEAKRIYCGKAPGRHSMPQAAIEAMMLEYALAGQQVVRLKGGDPFIFGRGGEEAFAAAAAGISYEVIPGISSAIGAAASAGIPLTHRGTSASVAFVTGSRCNDHRAPVDWEALAKGADTLVIYMGMSRVGEICRELMKFGKAARTPVALIENGTTDRERTVTGVLENIEKLASAMRIGNPALIVVGEVVTIREQLLALQQTAYSYIG